MDDEASPADLEPSGSRLWDQDADAPL